MPTADPIAAQGTFYPDTIDPMLTALAAAIAAATGAAIDEFTGANVIVVPPDSTDQGINQIISTATALKHGLCLLLVSGSAKNPDLAADGPRLSLSIEAQLYISTRVRGKTARSVLELLCALMKLLHHSQIRISGMPWYEEINVLGFDPLPDPDYTAYTVNMTRDFQL